MPIKIVTICGSVRPGNNTAKALRLVLDEFARHRDVEVAPIFLGKKGGRESQRQVVYETPDPLDSQSTDSSGTTVSGSASDGRPARQAPLLPYLPPTPTGTRARRKPR
jgi:hypothetical protein